MSEVAYQGYPEYAIDGNRKGLHLIQRLNFVNVIHFYTQPLNISLH